MQKMAHVLNVELFYNQTYHSFYKKNINAIIGMLLFLIKPGLTNLTVRSFKILVQFFQIWVRFL